MSIFLTIIGCNWNKLGRAVWATQLPWWQGQTAILAACHSQQARVLFNLVNQKGTYITSFKWHLFESLMNPKIKIIHTIIYVKVRLTVLSHRNSCDLWLRILRPAVQTAVGHMALFVNYNRGKPHLVQVCLVWNYYCYSYYSSYSAIVCQNSDLVQFIKFICCQKCMDTAQYHPIVVS